MDGAMYYAGHHKWKLEIVANWKCVAGAMAFDSIPFAHFLSLVDPMTN